MANQQSHLYPRDALTTLTFPNEFRRAAIEIWREKDRSYMLIFNLHSNVPLQGLPHHSLTNCAIRQEDLVEILHQVPTTTSSCVSDCTQRNGWDQVVLRVTRDAHAGGLSWVCFTLSISSSRLRFTKNKAYYFRFSEKQKASGATSVATLTSSKALFFFSYLLLRI